MMVASMKLVNFFESKNPIKIKEGYSENEIWNAMARNKGNVAITTVWGINKFMVVIDGEPSFFRPGVKDCKKGIERLKKYLPGAKFEIKPNKWSN